MKWSNIWLIFQREVRDQMRDRRTLFTIAILPILLYPLMATCFLQVSQFMQEHPTRIKVIGAESLPVNPALIENGQFSEKFCSAAESKLLQLSIVASEEARTPPDLAVDAEQGIRNGEYGAVLYFPPNFGQRLEYFREQVLKPRIASTADPSQLDRDKLSISVPQPVIYSNVAKDQSRIAYDRVSTVLNNWREAIVEENFRESQIPAAATRPFSLATTDVSDSTSRRAAVWSKLLPFIVLIWALTGAFYPAVDLCAGEKERGTLETLLCSPAARGEIVWGKLLTIMVFSAATSLLNMLSMGITGTFIINQMAAMGSSLQIGAPPLIAILWLTVALIPIAALFSALSLAIAAFARSSKEGQYYLMPLLLICLPLIILPVLPSAKLDWGTSLIPITGMMMLLRACIEGQYAEALRYVVPVVAATSICCLLAIRWAVDQFNNESVLFRESERWGLGTWLRRVFRERGATPTFGQAVLCGVVLLLIRFFANFLGASYDSWADVARVSVITQIGFIAAPGLLMAVMLTRNPLRSLGLVRTRWMALPAAVLLAVVLQPALTYLSLGIHYLYPINEETLAGLQPFETALREAGIWSVLLVLAVTPAICEELLFRGFMLSGLRHMGHKWLAILLTSVFFGVTHGILQQSISACLVGLVIGYIAVQTGSVLPCILFHLTHNSLTILRSRISGEMLDNPVWGAIFDTGQGAPMYSVASVVLGLAMALLILYWVKNLPYQVYEEERLKQALDHQPLHVASS